MRFQLFPPTSCALKLEFIFSCLNSLTCLPCVVNPGPNVSNSALVGPPSVTLPPLGLIIPYEKSLFDWLLERQENERVENHCEFDYVAVTVQSPLHCIPSQ